MSQNLKGKSFLFLCTLHASKKKTLRADALKDPNYIKDMKLSPLSELSREVHRMLGTVRQRAHTKKGKMKRGQKRRHKTPATPAGKKTRLLKDIKLNLKHLKLTESHLRYVGISPHSRYSSHRTVHIAPYTSHRTHRTVRIALCTTQPSAAHPILSNNGQK